MITSREAQRESYRRLCHSMPDKQRIVWQCLRQWGPTSNRLLAHQMGWDVNRVTGRIDELVKRGLVVLHGQMRDHETGRTVATWRALEVPQDAKRDEQLAML